MLSSIDVAQYIRKLFRSVPEDETVLFALLASVPGNFGWEVCVCKYDYIVPCSLGRMRYRDSFEITPWLIAGTNGCEERIHDVIRVGKNSWSANSYDDITWRFVPVRHRSVRHIYNYACNIGPDNIGIIEEPHLFHVNLA